MRSILVLLTLIVFFICFLPVMLVLFFLRKHHLDLSMRATRIIVRGVIRVMLFFSGTRTLVEGKEDIPDGANLYVANHRSYYDTLICYMCMDIPTGFVAKKELKRIPLLSQWIELIGSVFLDRSNIKEGLRAILKAIDIVKEGYSMVIFPEGTRNKNQNKDIPAEFKEGSLQIAKKAHCPIVPVAIKNTENCFETHVPWVRKNTVRISFLKPLYMENIPPDFKKFPARYIRNLIEEDLKREI